MITTNDATAPAPSGVRTGAEMIARHRFRLDADNNTAEVDSNGLAEEIDAALASLASDARQRGEPVGWQGCSQGSNDWEVITDPDWYRARGWEVRALYAHPAPATVEMREAAQGALDYLTLLYNEGDIDGQVGGEVISALAAALAPATEGRKG